ncbi:MAG: rSAM/selenodomain-associated transferase 1 [Gammaproteobacteria bacterium]|jgi:rSAM/selenodomain-associated transferase 1
MNKKEVALIIFTKTPVEGKVKTRLIPKWGTEGALLLYKDLLKQTLETAKSSNFDDIYLFCTPSIDSPLIKFSAKHFEIKLALQSGIDLGERIFNAFENKLAEYSKVILIGCDCPGITSHDIRTANNKLTEGADVVLGPSEDGGYYLIGLVQNQRYLFDNIKWGEDAVLKETRKKISELNLSAYELPERWDLDRPEDVYRYFEQKQNLDDC